MTCEGHNTRYDRYIELHGLRMMKVSHLLNLPAPNKDFVFEELLVSSSVFLKMNHWPTQEVFSCGEQRAHGCSKNDGRFEVFELSIERFQIFLRHHTIRTCECLLVDCERMGKSGIACYASQRISRWLTVDL